MYYVGSEYLKCNYHNFISTMVGVPVVLFREKKEQRLAKHCPDDGSTDRTRTSDFPPGTASPLPVVATPSATAGTAPTRPGAPRRPRARGSRPGSALRTSSSAS